MSPTTKRAAILVRLPEDLREALKREAERQNIPLNQFCANILAGAVGYRREMSS